MKFIGLVFSIVFLLGVSANGQRVITSGGIRHSILANVPDQPGTSQVTNLAVHTSVFAAVYETLDNFSDTMPFFIRGGSPAFTWSYVAGSEVRGYLSYTSGAAYLNHPFANPGNPDQSTRLTFNIQAQAGPKIRANQSQVVVPLSFTVSGQIAVFGAFGVGVPPSQLESVIGQGTGTATYRRRPNQLNTKVWRQSLQSQLYLSAVDLTFTAP